MPEFLLVWISPRTIESCLKALFAQAVPTRIDLASVIASKVLGFPCLWSEMLDELANLSMAVWLVCWTGPFDSVGAGPGRVSQSELVGHRKAGVLYDFPRLPNDALPLVPSP
jgi:hypothetical protein